MRDVIAVLTGQDKRGKGIKKSDIQDAARKQIGEDMHFDQETFDRMLSENSIGQAQSMHQLLGGKSKVSDVRSLIENNKTQKYRAYKQVQGFSNTETIQGLNDLSQQKQGLSDFEIHSGVSEKFSTQNRHTSQKKRFREQRQYNLNEV